MDRLLMLDAHIKTRSLQEIRPEFPQLVKHERALWECSDFQRLPYSLGGGGTLQLKHLRKGILKPQGPFVQPYMRIAAADHEPSLAQQLQNFFGGASTDRVLITSLSFLSAIEDNPDDNVLYVGTQYDHPSILPAEVVLQVETEAYTWVIIPHFDHTSGIANCIVNLTASIKEVSPQTKVAVDVSDTIGIEKMAFSAWGIDAVFSAAPSCHLALVTGDVDRSPWSLITARVPEALTSLLGATSRLESKRADVEAIKKELADTYEITLAPTETIALSVLSKIGAVRHFSGIINEDVVSVDVLVAKWSSLKS